MSDIFKTYATISAALSGRTGSLPPHETQKPAAVALIINEGLSGLEILLIERAIHPNDPWSGNIGLPGGRHDPSDRDLQHTAERETMEEVGIDLAGADYLGRLSDIVGHNLPVRVSCFVYGMKRFVQPSLSNEVNDAFWYDLSDLFSAERHVQKSVQFEGRLLEAPAIDLGIPGKQVLWGITYRLVTQFRQVLECGSVNEIPYELPL